MLLLLLLLLLIIIIFPYRNSERLPLSICYTSCLLHSVPFWSTIRPSGSSSRRRKSSEYRPVQTTLIMCIYIYIDTYITVISIQTTQPVSQRLQLESWAQTLELRTLRVALRRTVRGSRSPCRRKAGLHDHGCAGLHSIRLHYVYNVYVYIYI